MSRTLVSLGGEAGLFELVSHARRGPGRRERLSTAQIDLIARTVHRTPEVMVKVLTRGGKDLKAVGSHLRYLSRRGELEIETDEGQHLSGRGFEKAIIEDWDLDLDELRPSAQLRPWNRPPPKLAHKLIFSMPPGTPPTKVLEAVRTLAREEFALKHRYAMVLHTDEPHPHVHVVVKALGENGTRLNIRKDTLQRWRREFARHLRALGVPANATERVGRGISHKPQKDGIFRATLRGASTHDQKRTATVARELRNGALATEPGRSQLQATRREVLRGWAEVASSLEAQQESELAAAVRKFAREMPGPMTDQERIAEQLRRGRTSPRAPERSR